MERIGWVGCWLWRGVGALSKVMVKLMLMLENLAVCYGFAFVLGLDPPGGRSSSPVLV